MSKQSLVDRAIAQLEGEIAVLQLAIAKLRAQQDRKVPRPRVVKQSATENAS